MTCPDCEGDEFRTEGDAQVCRWCGLAVYAGDNLEHALDTTTLPAAGDVWWVDDHDDIRDENRLTVSPHHALRRLREAQIAAHAARGALRKCIKQLKGGGIEAHTLTRARSALSLITKALKP